MADISAQPIPDFGNLLTSFPRNEAAIENTQANTAYVSGPQTEATRAQAGLEGAQTGLVQQQTKRAAFDIAMIKQAMESLKKIPNGQDEKSGEQPANDPTETGVASALNKKMFVNPMGAPGLQEYINAVAWVNPAEAQRAEEWRNKTVATQTAKNQNEANDIFQTASALNNSNASLQTVLATTHPGTFPNSIAKYINSLQDKTPEEKDAMIRTAMESAAKYSHQYTGRETEIIGDEVRDKNTKFPVIGAPNAGLTAEQQVDYGKWTHTPQTMTIDNRTSTVRPIDVGIRTPKDVIGNKSIKFSVPPPGSGTQSQPGPGQPASPQQVRDLPSSQGGAPIPGLKPDQSDFVKAQPPGYPQVKGNQQLNSTDIKQRDIYLEQSKKLSETTNTEYTRAQDSVTQIKRINTLLKTPGLTLGPGSHEYSQLRTVLENWTGTAAGQAGAYQILTKVLNASEMNDLLTQFHSEGAQVRLGAYESRLIMEKLAANPNLTKSAIQQMLQWQGSDAQYTMDKAKVAGVVLQSGKSVANFEKNYSDKFPKQDIVDSSLSILNPKVNPKGGPNFDKAKGKTYTAAQVSEGAAKAGIPLAIFQDKLTKAGGLIH